LLREFLVPSICRRNPPSLPASLPDHHDESHTGKRVFRGETGDDERNLQTGK
jgi:hypothetical protein